jgi:hypothetical protein
MKLRIAAVLATAFALGACTDADWSHNMSFIGLDDQPAAEAGSQPAARTAAATPAAPVALPQGAQPAGLNPFCAAVAKQDSESNDFDATTQQGVFVRSYQQCVTIFGNAGPQ